jgi:hypothetical protein
MVGVIGPGRVMDHAHVELRVGRVARLPRGELASAQLVALGTLAGYLRALGLGTVGLLLALGPVALRWRPVDVVAELGCTHTQPFPDIGQPAPTLATRYALNVGAGLVLVNIAASVG